MSKQYLTIHTLDQAHPTDIFSLAPIPNAVVSASGSSSLQINSTTDAEFPLQQTITGAHKLGCHHLTSSANGKTFASAGFGGEVKVWKKVGEDEEGKGGQWEELGKLPVEGRTGEVWAISLGGDGRYLATSSYNGRICVWDLVAGPGNWVKAREYETKGSFGCCVAMSPDSRFVASGHENGSIFIFNNDSGRLLHSLPGLIRPVRALAFSPLSTLLAAAGDSRTISLSSVQSGEVVANLSGHTAWIMSLDFNSTGEYLLSGAFDGKCKVWNVESRTCVATHGESEKGLWSVKWLTKSTGQTGMGVGGMRGDLFAVAGAGRSISFYREASGG
ncbi:WD40 repeat-like protein [Venturia nashicola]|uniref:WD40 repeat-like protein n=1 Tax=Venturia nashicola TaxID=86259 RepID=A0A4Z1P079_9PEZI|nr:WD40 repeat-like protein [Venturia nashicola]